MKSKRQEISEYHPPAPFVPVEESVWLLLSPQKIGSLRRYPEFL